MRKTILGYGMWLLFSGVMVQQQNKEASLIKHEIAEGVVIAPPNYCINRSAESEFRMVTFSALRRARLCKALGCYMSKDSGAIERNMTRVSRVILFLFGLLLFSPCTFGQTFNEKLVSETENAYNPIPSPDGKMIAYVRTGRWEKGSGGLGQSNLRSEVKVMDGQGRILTERALAETFLAGWTSDGKSLICYRNREYFLVSLAGEKSKAVSYTSDNIVDRGTYLENIDAMIFVQHFYQPARGALRTADKVIVQNDASHLGKMLVPSPNGRYVAAIDVTRWAEDQIWVYDTQNKSWANLGQATIHPDIINPNNDWDWMHSTWNPWFGDSSHLAFISGSSIVVSTPDGKSRQTIIQPTGTIGLATPSPDGKQIAYVTFDAQLNKKQPQWTFWGNTRIWVVPTVSEAKARPVTNKASETTYCLRWLNNREIVFDRLPHESFTNNARLWKVRVE